MAGKILIHICSSSPSHKIKVEKEKLIECRVDGVVGNQNKTHEKVLSLPQDLICSNSLTCAIVQVSYEIDVVAIVSGCHGNSLLKTPITILHRSDGTKIPQHYQSSMPGMEAFSPAAQMPMSMR